MRVEVGVVVQAPEARVSMKGPTPHAVQARGAVGAHHTEAREVVADEVLDVQVPDVRTSSSPKVDRVPTATQPPDALQDTDSSELGEADTAGDQVVPTSDSITAPVPDDPVAVPTAVHPVAVGHETLLRAIAVWPAGRARRVALQVEPLSWSTKLLNDVVPTAVQACLTQETPVRAATVAPPGSIPVTAVHFLPFSDSTRACDCVVVYSPTAMHLDAPVQLTALSCALVAPAGRGRIPSVQLPAARVSTITIVAPEESGIVPRPTATHAVLEPQLTASTAPVTGPAVAHGSVVLFHLGVAAAAIVDVVDATPAITTITAATSAHCLRIIPLPRVMAGRFCTAAGADGTLAERRRSHPVRTEKTAEGG